MPRRIRSLRRWSAGSLALILLQSWAAPAACGYVFNYVVPDVRQPPGIGGNTACPQRFALDPLFSNILGRFWATTLGSNPVNVLTLSQDSSGRLTEVENSIERAFDAWVGVSGNVFATTAPLPLNRLGGTDGCQPDGYLAVCFRQIDPAFTFGVLAFTRVITADTIGAQLTDDASPSTFPGQILDADILLRPNDPTVAFATPEALPGNPAAYDLDSVLTHKMGHVFGLGHSGVWRAIMFPYIAPPGTFIGPRATPDSPDAALSEDDRTTMRVLYPDPYDALHGGSIRGRVLPANPLALANDPAAPTGIFGAQVVAVDDASGAVIASTVSGWTCSDPGPPIFDGSYVIEGLPATGQNYRIYAEPLDGPLSAADAFHQATLCRNPLTDAGWPSPLACITPTPYTGFSTRMRAGP